MLLIKQYIGISSYAGFPWLLLNRHGFERFVYFMENELTNFKLPFLLSTTTNTELMGLTLDILPQKSRLNFEQELVLWLRTTLSH